MKKLFTEPDIEILTFLCNESVGFSDTGEVGKDNIVGNNPGLPGGE